MSKRNKGAIKYDAFWAFPNAISPSKGSPKDGEKILNFFGLFQVLKNQKLNQSVTNFEKWLTVHDNGSRLPESSKLSNMMASSFFLEKTLIKEGPACQNSGWPFEWQQEYCHVFLKKNKSEKVRNQKWENRRIRISGINFENWYITVWKLKTDILTHLEVLYLDFSWIFAFVKGWNLPKHFVNLRGFCSCKIAIFETHASC